VIVAVCLLLPGSRLAGQPEAPAPLFVCPMDPEVRSKAPGKCPRCGMKLEPGIPQPVEYPMEFRAEPPSIPAGREVTLSFRVLDPKSEKPVSRFEIVHEKLFHLFLVSYDLEYFAHEHPEFGRDAWFRLKTRLPKPGHYRLLADFDPSGGTPQLAARTFTTAGYTKTLEQSIAHPAQDLAPKQAANLKVELRMEPEQPIAGKKTMLFFRIDPAGGLEQYIGAWAHLLAVSNDLIDTIHSHPFIADGGPNMQFNVFFPREAIYRIWVQLQRNGVVNTVSFTVPVTRLR
jgi:Heavy metal binding domain